MNALAFLIDAHARGVRIALGANGEKLTIDAPDGLDRYDRRRLAALKPEIRSLLRTELPDAMPSRACDAFAAARGVALCATCAHGLGAHFWKTADCTFSVGTAGDSDCRRCGEPAMKHRDNARLPMAR